MIIRQFPISDIRTDELDNTRLGVRALQIEWPGSNHRDFFVLTPHLTEHIAHLTHRRVGAYSFKDRGHHVVGAPRGASETFDVSKDGARYLADPDGEGGNA